MHECPPYLLQDRHSAVSVRPSRKPLGVMWRPCGDRVETVWGSYASRRHRPGGLAARRLIGAQPSGASRRPCGCRISCHLMRPGHIRGLGRRAGPAAGPRSHMKRPVKLLQVCAWSVPGLTGSWWFRWGCGGVPVWPHVLDSCQIVRAGGRGHRGAERSRSDAAGALDAGSGEPMMGAARGMGIPGLPLPWAGGGASGRGGVPGRRGGCRRHCHSHIRGSGPQACIRQDGAPHSGRESRVRSQI